MTESTPQRCSNCGAQLYAQWWSRSDAAFKCRVCGTLNPGAAPNIAPPTRLIWPLWGCSGIFALLAIWSIVIYLQAPAGSEGASLMLGMGVVPAVAFALGLLVVAAISTWLIRRRG